jgi:shikimate dehydrogenase
MKEGFPAKLYGLIGYPVKHSFSPAMHNAAFKAARIPAEYHLFEVRPEELQDFLLNPDKEVKDTEGKTFSAGDIAGFNITIPHKVKAKEILVPADLEEFRKKQESGEQSINIYAWHRMVSGAINTVKRDENGLTCYNTDVAGFMKSLDENLRFSSRNEVVLLFGCGGAGRAAVAGLSFQQVRARKIYIYDNNQASLDSAKEQFAKFTDVNSIVEFITQDEIKDKIKDCHLLINASPVGMKEPDPSIVDKELLHGNLAVYDVVYNRETQLIKDAKEKGLSAINGRNMLAYQGALAWGLWMNKTEPVDIMLKALEAKMGS